MNLNKASLDVWYDLLQEEKYQRISDRIIYLDTQDSLDEDEVIELKTLIKLEKKFLASSTENVENNKKIIKKVSYYKNNLQKDERLLTIFLDRVKNRILDDKEAEKELSDEIVTQEYVNMMEEDMDIKGHDKLNKLYKDMLVSRETGVIFGDEYESCGNPKCIYCKPSDQKEADEAYQRLMMSGLLDGYNEDTLIGLMITIARLEGELSQYTNLECLDDEDEDDIEGFDVDKYIDDEDDE